MSFTTKLLLAITVATFLIIAGVFATNSAAVLTCMLAGLALFGVTVNDKRLIDHVIGVIPFGSR